MKWLWAAWSVVMVALLGFTAWMGGQTAIDFSNARWGDGSVGILFTAFYVYQTRRVWKSRPASTSSAPADGYYIIRRKSEPFLADRAGNWIFGDGPYHIYVFREPPKADAHLVRMEVSFPFRNFEFNLTGRTRNSVISAARKQMSAYGIHNMEEWNGSNRTPASDHVCATSPRATLTCPACKAARAGAGEGTREGGLPVVTEDQPVLAVRAAHLHIDSNTKQPFGSVNQSFGRFGVDEFATCKRGEYRQIMAQLLGDHVDDGPSPHHDDECGFYAKPADLPPSYNGSEMVQLEVELSGKIIHHDTGYRAQHQRVLSCSLPACAFCGKKAERVLTAKGYMVKTVCEKHGDMRMTMFGYDLVPIAQLDLPVPVIRLGED